MIQTRIMGLFGIRYPILQSGMNYVTEPELVAAVCNAGGLGLLACARFTPDEVRKGIQEIRKLTDKPFGINQALRGGGEKNVQVAIEEKVPVVNYSLGKPTFIADVHKYGGKVIGTVAIAKHALSAEKMGVDAVIATGHEAAGHPDVVPTFVLVPLVAKMVKVPVIAAGGVADGRGLAAALILGADAVAMGTRFVLSRESIVHDAFKQLCLKAAETDTLYSDKFDGMPARVLKTPASEKLYNGHLNMAEATRNAMNMKRELSLSWPDFIMLSIGMMRGDEKMNLLQQARLANYANRLKKAIFAGNLQEGIMPLGMVCGAIRDLPTVKEIIDRTMKEAEDAVDALNEKRLTSRQAG